MSGDDAQVSVDTLWEDVSGDAVLVTVAAADVRAVLARLADLEAAQINPSGVEWGFWWNGPAAEGGGIEPCGSRGIAEELARAYPGQGTVRQRDVYAPGPWREVSP